MAQTASPSSDSHSLPISAIAAALQHFEQIPFDTAGMSPDREINEFMENFEAEISLEGREKDNSSCSSRKMTNKLSTPAMRDSEGERCGGSGEVIGGMVRVQSLSSSGRYSPSIVAQEDNHDFDEGNVDDFLDEMEELVDER